MTEFSPVAQSVLDATYREMDYAPRRHVCCAAAAALRAAVAATQTHQHEGHWRRDARDFLTIATELEGR